MANHLLLLLLLLLWGATPQPQQYALGLPYDKTPCLDRVADLLLSSSSSIIDVAGSLEAPALLLLQLLQLLHTRDAGPQKVAEGRTGSIHYCVLK